MTAIDSYYLPYIQEILSNNKDGCLIKTQPKIISTLRQIFKYDFLYVVLSWNIAKNNYVYC